MYRDLLVWQKAMALVTQIYEQTRTLPKDEQYGLTSQIRRSAVSIPANIAEGYGRNSTQDYILFFTDCERFPLRIGTMIDICRNLSFIGEQECAALFEQLQEIERMLNSLIAKIGKSFKNS